jgi:DNA polymerase III subunit epsilon
MEKIELPPKYYLDHFLDMIRTLKSHYSFLLEEEHHDFLKRFHHLSEDAKCLYIRIANRKGVIFDKRSFEFSNWEELKAAGFTREAEERDEELFIGWAKKDHLKAILERGKIPFKKSASKGTFLELFRTYREQLGELKSDLEHLIIHEAHKSLQYILFVFFGKIQDSLILYTLRDLGIRKTSAQKSVKPKFETLEEAKSLYFYSTLREIPLDWPRAIGSEAEAMKEKFLLRAAEAAKKLEEHELALSLYRLCQTYPATEKRARYLYERGLKDECLRSLQKMMDDPSEDEELLFAEDFLARKFGSKKISLLTETLRNASQVTIDDSFYRHPEFGVIEEYKKKGAIAHFSENFLWGALFGMFFHEQLSKIETHSEFDRVPQDLRGKFSFSGLENWNWEAALEEDYGESEYFILTEESKEMVRDFLTHAPKPSVEYMLRYLSADYWNRHTGFPDIFVIENGDVKFIEIKAEGDSLKKSQLKQMRELEKAGLKVEVLNVVYQYNPDQVYVVVDLETTGHLTGYNRITEIAAVKVVNAKIVDRFQTLVNPGRSIPRNIQDLTGITNSMVARAPAFHEVADKFYEFSKDAIFVAHNVSFDYGFLQKEFERLEKRFVRPYICTKAGMRKHYPKLDSYGLKNLTRHFEIPLLQHHRAMSDAEAATGLLNLINLKRSEVSSSGHLTSGTHL